MRAEIHQTEGVISGSLDLVLDGVSHTVENHINNWWVLKHALDSGSEVVVIKCMLDGSSKERLWAGSPSYLHRFSGAKKKSPYAPRFPFAVEAENS